MPTFCRHNRFIERCSICSKTLPDAAPGRGASGRPTPRRAGGSATRTRRPRTGAEWLSIRRETRAAEDGYSSELVPGLRASADAARLAGELAFASGRLLALAADPPGVYGEIRARAEDDLEGATWSCFLLAYLSPVEDDDPFAGIRAAIAVGPARGAPPADGELPDPDLAPLGPRTSHQRGRGVATLRAYLQWAARGGLPTAAAARREVPASQSEAFTGDPGWTAERRFDRAYERLALPGLTRGARYDLLVTLGRLGLYPLSAASLQLAQGRGPEAEDTTTQAAKRVFGIADPHLLERRARALAGAAGLPIDAFDVGLANWIASQPATLGMTPEVRDEAAFERISGALGL
jgi:hypothetical protein